MKTATSTHCLAAISCFLLLAALPATAQDTPRKAPELWFYYPVNLQVDANITQLEPIWRRAAKAGYTKVLLTDSKFGRLSSVIPRYFENAARVKALAHELNLEIVPTVFPMGWSDALLANDPNLVEALPVRDALFEVRNGEAHPVTDPATTFRDGGFDDLTKWEWHDPCVTPDNGTAHVTGAKGMNARIEDAGLLNLVRRDTLPLSVTTEAGGRELAEGKDFEKVRDPKMGNVPWPGGQIYVWSDMFDPSHNAVEHYYLAHGSLAGSWKGLAPATVVANWNFGKRDASLAFFADCGHRQLIAGYYDVPREQLSAATQAWLASAARVKGADAFMYTTWANRYDDVERFAEIVRALAPHTYQANAGTIR